MNKKAIAKISWILKIMDEGARKRNAPVNRIEKLVKNDPFRSLVFTILSARTKDENTMIAAKNLLAVAPTPKKLATMPLKKIEKLVRSAGFYRMKAKNLKNMAKMLIRDFNSRVPNSMENLLKLPGVGRKTANIILVYSFGKNAIPVDIHVHRISNRLGLVKTKMPEQTEKALERVVDKKYWKKLNHSFVAYGQTICLPRNPKCNDKECKIRKLCWRVGVS